MLRSFTSWLEEEVTDAGPIGVIEAGLCLLGFGVLLSSLFGSSAIKATAIVVVSLAFLGVFALLTAERRRWRRKMTRDHRLLAHYCHVIKGELETTMHMLSWDDVATIAPNGDTKEVITVHGRVETKQLYFFRLRVGQGPGLLLSKKQQKRVAYAVRGVVVDQTGGTRWDASDTWLPDGRLEVLVHLNFPAPRGSEVRICMELDWPGMCAQLLRHREPDTFELHFARQADHVRYVIVLPPGEDAYYEPIGFKTGENGFRLTGRQSSAGQVEVELIADDLPAGHRAGMRLDLK